MTKPNIVLINCDDLGYGDIACYGSELNETPVLDQLAKDGIKFTNFYMASPVCSPSRGGMLTGCYPPRIGFGKFGPNGNCVLLPGDAEGLSKSEHTIAELLQDCGYYTKIIGKWHCGDQPEFLPCNHGFDEYFGLPYSNDMARQTNINLAPLPLMRQHEVVQHQPDQVGLTERYTEESVRFIRENKDRPFFLYLAHMYVHVPIFVPERFKKESKNGTYGGAIAHVDWTTKVLVHELKRLGLFENTIVIFTSDNGGYAGVAGSSCGDLRGSKGTSFEGGFKVPGIFHWPAGIKQSAECTQMVTSMDLLPTLVKVAGGEVPTDNPIDGVDFSHIFADPTAESKRKNFAYFFRNTLEAVRDEEWKLHLGISNASRTLNNNAAYVHPALFNLINDPNETEDLYEQYPEVVAKLMAYAEEVRQELGDDETNRVGCGNRPVGRVENPKTLTEYDEDHPYMVAMYDIGGN